MRQNIAPTACRVSVHAVVVAVGLGEEATCRREMKRFMSEEAGPDSDRIWEIRKMNQCYHSEAKYGTLSRSLSRERRKGGAYL